MVNLALKVPNHLPQTKQTGCKGRILFVEHLAGLFAVKTLI